MLWLNRHAAAMLAATLVGAVVQSGAPVALAAAASFAVCAHRNRAALAALRPYGGYANLLTALRLAFILYAAALLPALDRSAVLALFAANVALDVADGYAARRAGQATSLGALLDRETDAVFVMVAYLYFFLAADAGAWILVPGVLPYLYRLFVVVAGEPARDVPRQRHAAVLAGANFACLLAAVAAPPAGRGALLVLSAAIVLVSFGVSFWKLHRHEYSLS